MGAREKAVEKQVKIEAQRWHPVGAIFRTAAGGGRPAPGAPWLEFLPEGWPDYTFLLRGRILGVETKAKRGRLEPSQVKMMRAWHIAGCPIIAPRSGAEFVEGVRRAMPDVCHLPTEEEVALFRDAYAAEWKDDPKAWLKKEGAL